MVDNSPSSSNQDSSTVEETFAPLQRGRFHLSAPLSTSSSSDHDHDSTPSSGGNAVIQWATPKSNLRGGLRKRDDPFMVAGVMNLDFGQVGDSPPDADFVDEKQKMSTSVRWKDILEGPPADTSSANQHKGNTSSPANQSRQSLLSEHPLSSSLNQTGLKASSSQNPDETGFDQSRFEPFTEMTDDHTQDPSVRTQTLFQAYQPSSSTQPIQFSQPRIRLPPSSLSTTSGTESTPSPQKSHHHHTGHFYTTSFSQMQKDHQQELNSQTLDPTYSEFLPSHTSSQLTEKTSPTTSGHGEAVPSVGRIPIDYSYAEPNQEFLPLPHHHHLYPSSSDGGDDDASQDARSEMVRSHRRDESGKQNVASGGPSATSAGRYSGGEELSQHSINDSGPGKTSNADSQIILHHPDPSKDSLSSIEEARSQSDQEQFNNPPLMPLFSDVSISQRSMSFESEEQGQRLSGQVRRSSESKTTAFSVSDRYSLPGFYGNDNTTDQSSLGTEWPPAVPRISESWQQVERSRFTGQRSVDSGEFQPLHEMTSSTLPTNEVGSCFVIWSICYPFNSVQ